MTSEPLKDTQFISRPTAGWCESTGLVISDKIYPPTSFLKPQTINPTKKQAAGNKYRPLPFVENKVPALYILLYEGA